MTAGMPGTKLREEGTAKRLVEGGGGERRENSFNLSHVYIKSWGRHKTLFEIISVFSVHTSCAQTANIHFYKPS